MRCGETLCRCPHAAKHRSRDARAREKSLRRGRGRGVFVGHQGAWIYNGAPTCPQVRKSGPGLCHDQGARRVYGKGGINTQVQAVEKDTPVLLLGESWPALPMVRAIAVVWDSCGTEPLAKSVLRLKRGLISSPPLVVFITEQNHQPVLPSGRRGCVDYRNGRLDVAMFPELPATFSSLDESAP